MEIDCPSTSKPDENSGPSEHVHPSQSQPQVSARIASPVLYGDEYLSVEEELVHPNPRECFPIFSEGEGVKGPIFNEEDHRAKLPFFKPVLMMENTPCHLLAFGLMSKPYTILGFYRRTIEYFLMNISMCH